MTIEVKNEKGEVVSSREVDLKDLNLIERGKFLDIMRAMSDINDKNHFSNIISVCRLCTNYPDDELNKFSDGELVQLFEAIISEKVIDLGKS